MTTATETTDGAPGTAILHFHVDTNNPDGARRYPNWDDARRRLVFALEYYEGEDVHALNSSDGPGWWSDFVDARGVHRHYSITPCANPNCAEYIVSDITYTRLRRTDSDNPFTGEDQ